MSGTFKKIKADAGQPQHSGQTWQGTGNIGKGEEKVSHCTPLSFRSLHLGKMHDWYWENSHLKSINVEQ